MFVLDDFEMPDKMDKKIVKIKDKTFTTITTLMMDDKDSLSFMSTPQIAILQNYTHLIAHIWKIYIQEPILFFEILGQFSKN